MSSIKMVKTKESMNLNKCVREIKKDIVVLGTSVELSDEFFTSCNSWFATYEKYYYRTNSTIALSILLEEVDDRFEVYLIVAAGGGGVFNFSYGSETNLLDKAVRYLQSKGFK